MIFDREPDHSDEIALDDLERRRTWAELADRCARYTRLLREDLGLAPDDHAAVLMGNRVECVELTVAALLAGIWLTPVNRHASPDEIGYVLRDSGARVLFTDPEHEASVDAGPERIVAGADLEARLAAAGDAPPDLEGPAGGNMIYTSGTTGHPKGVQRRRAGSVREALAAARRYGEAVGLDGRGPHLVTGPTHHAAPLMFAVYDLLAGAPMIVMPRWDEREALSLLHDRAVRHTHLVPTMCVRLLRLPEEEREAFRAPALSLVLHGAAPITPEVKRRMIEWWGEVLVEYWGGTEGGVTTLVDSADWLAHPGTVGRAVPWYEVFAVDEEGQRLPPGEVGTLYSRHLQQGEVFRYHDAPEKTAAAYLPSGAFTLGDVGFVDPDGWVHLVDRKSHTIISGGVNMYPAEIERALLLHPAVADAGVFGIPDDEWGESVKAAVELEEGFEPSDALAAEILDFARRHLARYKVPRSIDFERELPRDASGKLRVRELRDRYWQGRSRAI